MSSHAVAVIGGASAGAEVSAQLAKRGLRVVVFEQNPKPYGKIEDGLPRWHEAQREKEYGIIADKLSHEHIDVVPCTKVGQDISLADLVDEWGFNGVVLACGAWSDRLLSLEGAEQFVGRGLLYQNPFIYWFNHFEEEDYQGPAVEVEDAAIVVGGGLASIDVAKVLMLETTRHACRERGIDIPLNEMEHSGIPKALAKHDLRWEELGLQGCTLVYRRRVEDMPLMDMPEGASEDRRAKVEAARARMLKKAQDKYLFKVEALAQPERLLIEDDRLAGLELRRTKADGSSLTPTEETFELRATQIVSSIGSIPEPIPGLAMKGERYAFSDWDRGQIANFTAVFAAGNAVTGKGNIVASRRHATQISEVVAEALLGVAADSEAGREDVSEHLAADASESAKRIAEAISQNEPLSEAQLTALLERVHERQREVSYPGQLTSWLAKC